MNDNNNPILTITVATGGWMKPFIDVASEKFETSSQLTLTNTNQTPFTTQELKANI